MKPLKFQYTKFLFQRAHDFAEKSLPTIMDQYKDRNQSNPEVVLRNTRMGKLAEFGVWAILVQELGFLNRGLTRPDEKIYTKDEKSFAADMTCEDNKFHCKSYRVGSPWEPSWIAQVGGKKGFGHTDPTIDGGNTKDFTVLCFVDFDKKEVEIQGIVNTPILKEKDLYKEPEKKDYSGIKKAIYYRDILTLTEEERWSFAIQAAKQNS